MAKAGTPMPPRGLPSRAEPRPAPAIMDAEAWSRAALAFVPFTVGQGRWSVAWEWMAEGDDGAYTATDADTPRLRATLFYKGDPVTSALTLATPVTPPTEMKEAARDLLDEIAGREPADLAPDILARWVWRQFSA